VIKRRPAQREVGFHEPPALVKGAGGDRMPQHHVFSAHEIAREGQKGSVPEPCKNVHVEEGGLHHKDVRSFLFVQKGLPESLLPVCGGHLVRSPVPE